LATVLEKSERQTMPGLSTLDRSACASCGQALTGGYCSRCGEKALDPHALTVRHFIFHTLLHETVHVDGKIWRTLRTLFARPGLLSVEYCAGRRNRYVNPTRMLVTAIVTYALLTQGGLLVTLQLGPVTLSTAPTKVRVGETIADTVSRLDRFGALARLLAKKEQSADLTSESAADKFHRKLEGFSEPLSFTNVLLLAFVLYAFFHRRRPLFVEHGVFSMHLVSFVLFSSVAFLAAIWMLKINQAIGILMLFAVCIWQFAYMALAIRRFYFAPDAGRIRRAVLAATAAFVIYLLNSAFITSVQLFGAALALWSL
jgi:hypothetical protein